MSLMDQQSKFLVVTDQSPDDDSEKAALIRLAKLQEMWDNDHNQRDRWKRAKRIAEGGALELIQPMPAEDGDHFAAKPKASSNILGVLLSRLSQLYAVDPAREMVNEGELEWAKSKLWEFGDGLTSILHDADRMVHLMGTVLARCEYAIDDEPLDIPRLMSGAKDLNLEEDGIRVDLFTRDRFVVLTHPDDGRFASAVLLHISTEVYGDLVKSVFHYYDSKYFIRTYIKGNLPPVLLSNAREEDIPSGILTGSEWLQEKDLQPLEHGMEKMPIVPLRLKRPNHEFYVGGILGPHDDLLVFISGILTFLSEFEWTAMLQRGQPWVVGQLKSWLMSCDAPIEVDEAGNFGISPNEANLEGMIAALKYLLTHLASEVDLPHDTFEITSSDSSLALQFNSRHIKARLESHKKVAMGWERAISKCSAMRYNAARGTNIKGDVATKHHVIEPTLSNADQLALVEFEHDQGLASDLEIKRRLHQNLSEQEAEKAIEAGREDREKRVAERVAIAGHAGDSKPGDPMNDPKAKKEAPQDGPGQDQQSKGPAR